MGQIHTSKKDYEKAFRAFEKAIEIQPTWPAPHKNLARLYLLQGIENKAIAKLEAALVSNPKNPAHYLSLGALYEQNKNYQKAMQIYEQAIENIPNLWVASNNLAFLLSENFESSEDLAEALKLTKKAQKLRPDEVAVIDTLGWIYYKKGNNKRAFGLIEKALSSAPENPVFNYHMGMVLYRGGRVDEAGEKLKKSLENNEVFMGRADAEKTLNQIS